MNRIGRVMLFATDVARLQAFYAAVLGAPVEVAVGWVVFETGGVQIALHAIPPQCAQPRADPPVERSDTALKFAFVVDDVAAMRTELVTRGATMRDPQTFGPRTVCDGVDPEGNVFQISNA